MRSTVRSEESFAARWATARGGLPNGATNATASSTRRSIVRDPFEVGHERYLRTGWCASHPAAPRDLRFGERVEFCLLVGGQIIADGRDPLICFSLKPFHLRAHAIEARAHLGGGLLPRLETTALHLLPEGLALRGGVLQHSIERDIGRTDLGALVGGQVERPAQRVDGHPVIRRRLETGALAVGRRRRWCLAERRHG